MITEAPRDLRYSSPDGEKYRKLVNDELSPFYGATFKDVFIYAATYGFKNGLHKELEKPQPSIPLSTFTAEDEWLVKSIAVAEKRTLDVLSDEKEIYRLAEEYANGALETLYLEIFGGKPGEPYKRMSQEILEDLDRQQHNSAG